MNVSSTKNVLVTYIYPQAVKYFNDLSNSILDQTNQEFDLIVFSDQVSEKEVNKPKLEFSLIPLEGSILEIRLKSFEILKSYDYDKIIFIDADDTMTNDRIETVSTLLDNHALVCNDLNLMDESGHIFKRNIWERRLNIHYKFGNTFIQDKNIVGFGNTGIRKALLNYTLAFSAKTFAADWFIFYQILKASKCEAIFTSKCQTNYRQHNNNEAGLQPITIERVKHAIEIKKAHYVALCDLGYNELGKEYQRILKFEETNCFELSLNIIPDNLFWWEETNYIKF